MPDSHPTPSPAEEFNGNEGTILLWLLDSEQQRPWSVEEIVREFGSQSAIDALNALHGAGLIHRTGEFVWATRAAIRADEIRL